MQDIVNPPRILLIGGFSEVIELCLDCGVEIAGIIDTVSAPEIRGIPVLGDDRAAAALDIEYKNLPIIICPDKPKARNELAAYYASLGFRVARLVHPGARISVSARLGQGCIISSGVNISADVKLGEFVTVNVNSNVMHDSVVGAHSTVAPNVVILGRVTIGDMVYVGANSTILPSCRVGDGAIVGAGAVVTKDVDEHTTVVSFPARPMSK